MTFKNQFEANIFTVLCFMFCVLFVLGDTASTMYSLEYVEGRELNPVIDAVIGLPGGWAVVGLFKFGVFLMFYGVLLNRIQLGIERWKVFGVLGTLNAIMLFAVSNNFWHYAF